MQLRGRLDLDMVHEVGPDLRVGVGLDRFEPEGRGREGHRRGLRVAGRIDLHRCGGHLQPLGGGHQHGGRGVEDGSVAPDELVSGHDGLYIAVVRGSRVGYAAVCRAQGRADGHGVGIGDGMGAAVIRAFEGNGGNGGGLDGEVAAHYRA